MRIIFRISEETDPDLYAAAEQLPKRKKSEICREALRAFLMGEGTNISKTIETPHRIKLALSDEDMEGEAIDPEDKVDDLLSLF